MVFPAIKTAKPDQYMTKRLRLTTKWEEIYTKEDNMDSVDIGNRSSITVQYSEKEKPKDDEYDDLFAGDWTSIDTDVEAIYARSSAKVDPMPIVVVKKHYFSEERMAELREEAIEFFREVFRGMLPGGMGGR